MLRLIDIKKVYESGDSKVQALKGVSIAFRRNEFVSILGHSGCGKTTLLNIIGGLDKYTSGDLVINQTSTKMYKDRDWDNYRNHSIGFVFQSYNLIPHQTVLGNVELALTLSGVKRSERKALAQAALVKVGLGDQIHKRPNQLSGGQMQRVAIARAIVNNPDIILADEPTGALDTETSVQVMQILKELAQDKLVVMVTHNPELAEEYSTRIVRLKDGEVVSDSMPYEEEEEATAQDASPSEDAVPEVAATTESEKPKGKKKKPSMSLFTAFSLSIRNLFTKKGRTFLTAFAGSIGIIGIALILSLSNGFQNYIDMVERDTLSSYPVTITETSYSLEAIMDMMVSEPQNLDPYPDNNTLSSNDVLTTLLKSASGSVAKNDLASFKTWLDANPDKVNAITNAVKYIYSTNFCVFKEKTTTQLYPFEVPASMVNSLVGDGNTSVMSEYLNTMMSQLSIWEEMVDNEDLLRNKQYDLLEGHWPRTFEETGNECYEVVLVVDKYNRINDYLMCAIGLETLPNVFLRSQKETITPKTYNFQELIGKTFTVILGADKYEKTADGWVDKTNAKDYKNYITEKLDNGVTLKISGIIRPKETVTSAILSGVIGYNHDLTEYIINKTNEHPMVVEQRENPEVNVLTGEAFEEGEDAEFVLTQLGAVSLDKPSAIYLYAKGFEEKKAIADLVEEYNSTVPEDKHIKYNDLMATLMSSVSSIIDIISYVLIAFVSISLIVSSIMIGIITYISVLERTKEIGVLRSIGASKRDVSRLFNAETLTVGFMSGVFGILITLLLNIPVNIVIKSLTGISGLSSMPVLGAFALIAISMFLSFIAGFIPSKIAAKKDPVVALRTE